MVSIQQQRAEREERITRRHAYEAFLRETPYAVMRRQRKAIVTHCDDGGYVRLIRAVFGRPQDSVR